MGEVMTTPEVGVLVEVISCNTAGVAVICDCAAFKGILNNVDSKSRERMVKMISKYFNPFIILSFHRMMTKNRPATWARTLHQIRVSNTISANAAGRLTLTALAVSYGADDCPGNPPASGMQGGATIL